MSSLNTSGFKGVDFMKTLGKWRARIRSNGTRLNLGVYNSKEEANVAIVKARDELHGEFANHG